MEKRYAGETLLGLIIIIHTKHVFRFTLDCDKKNISRSCSHKITLIDICMWWSETKLPPLSNRVLGVFSLAKTVTVKYRNMSGCHFL